MLTGAATKWYVDQPRETHYTLVNLATTFVSYFQLPLCYDTGTEILTSFHQTHATCLSNHV